MNYRLVLRILGRILFLEAAAMLPSLAVSLIYGDDAALSFLITMTALLLIGAIPRFAFKGESKSMRPSEGFIAVALCWIAISVFGALPFVFSGTIPNYIDALFETISGFTTTGASILPFVEGLPESIIFWRSFTHWIGGMGVLVLTLAILPAGEHGVYNLIRAEATGPASERIVPRLRKMSIILYVIYLALSAIQLVFLLCGGMNVFDSLIHMFSTAGTGGFSSRNMSIGAYNSPFLEYTIGAFMMLFSINFSMYYALITRKFTQILKNTEFKAFIIMIVASTGLIAVDLMLKGGYTSLSVAIRHSFFQVTSISSTTGYSTVDFNLWPEFSKSILLIIMAVGACAGSTAGGLKVVRVVMICKSAFREIKKIVHPRSVSVVHMNGQAVQDKTLTGVLHYFVIYVIIVILATLIISLESMGLETSFSEVLTMISNTGPGFGLVGPTANYSGFSVLSKLVMSMCMLVGRLEIYPILMLMLPSAWKKG